MFQDSDQRQSGVGSSSSGQGQGQEQAAPGKRALTDAVVQPAVNGADNAAPVAAPVAAGAGFQRVSQNGKIVIKSQQEAYASDEMFGAANGGSLAVSFVKGPQLALPPAYAEQYPNAGALYQLMPRMKPAPQGTNPSREQQAAMAHSPVEGDSDEEIARKHEVFKQYITKLLAEIKAFVRDVDAAVRKAIGRTIPDENTLVPGALRPFLMSRVNPFIVGPLGQVLGPMLGTPIGGFENLASRAGDAANPLKLVELNAWLSWFNSHYSAEAEKELSSPASSLALPNDCGSVSALVAGKSNMQEHVAEDPAIGQTFKVNYGADKGQESWNVHWAAAVMKDGGDTLSLETGVQPGRFAGGKTYWSYNLYGSGGDQTFAAQTDRANDAHIATQQRFNAKAGF